ncbi:hypothetical protein [Stappia sp. ES.058]|uniref:hypothetical protein n=1 Tax=Stappia sp. ES.058 TaxID=1881061 RepID=UPI00087A83F6|nr:hypothetical protein [Stappia sp. ES.058]SDU42620.1 hypothetical protein SAMN05428979_3710 [Stappia sp. ES.058]
MGKKGSDFYKAAIGAPDNFMSTYYYVELKNLDASLKQKPKKIKSPQQHRSVFELNPGQTEVDLDNPVTRFFAYAIGWFFLAFGMIGMSMYIIMGLIGWLKSLFSAVL